MFMFDTILLKVKMSAIRSRMFVTPEYRLLKQCVNAGDAFYTICSVLQGKRFYVLMFKHWSNLVLHCRLCVPRFHSVNCFQKKEHQESTKNVLIALYFLNFANIGYQFITSNPPLTIGMLALYVYYMFG